MIPAVAFKTSFTVSGADIGTTKKDSIFDFGTADFTFFVAKSVEINEVVKLLGVLVS